MDFDPVTGLIYGVGIQVFSPTNYRRVMLTLSTATKQITLVAPIPGYVEIWSTLSTLDYKNRKHYSILQPPGAPTLPFHLIEYDLTTNNITNSPDIGGIECSTCPFGMHYSPI